VPLLCGFCAGTVFSHSSEPMQERIFKLAVLGGTGDQGARENFKRGPNEPGCARGDREALIAESPAPLARTVTSERSMEPSPDRSYPRYVERGPLLLASMLAGQY